MRRLIQVVLCAASLLLVMACGGGSPSSGSGSGPQPPASVTDVYIVGSENSAAGTSVAKVWKNGMATDLTTGDRGARADSVFVKGSDVYVAGVQAGVPGGPGSIAKYWKNGLAIPLQISLTDPNRESVANSVFVYNDDAYVGGYQKDQTNTFNVATYWKNGAPTTVGSGTKTSMARSIFVNVH